MESAVASLRAPASYQLVYREECTRCFDNQDGELGIDLCLTCYNGSCPHASANDHAALHFSQTAHPIALNIKRTRKPITRTKRDSNEPPIKKLAIREEPSEQEQYTFSTTPIFYTHDSTQRIPQSEKLDGIIAAVMNSLSSAQKSEVKAWEEEILSCVHTRECVQVDPKALEPAGLACCAHEGCGLTSNLWLCLSCGSLGCGRPQHGGRGGNGHGLEHTKTSNHPVAVKMGTIEPEGTADVYCYSCDDAKLDPLLAKHLGNFGIEVASQTKTEKSMTELQVEQNLKFDFAMTGADGKELEPLCGPGLTGLKNLGNSCYIASTLQAIFSLSAFQDRYLPAFANHALTCSASSPATCFECQICKIADGLLSGRYAVPRQTTEADDAQFDLPESTTPSTAPAFQEGIKPIMFKTLIGKDHEEFSTMKQQDADDFFKHLVKNIKQSTKASGAEDPTKIFTFEQEWKLQCGECGGVRYRTQVEESIGLPIPFVAKENAMAVDGEEKRKVEYEEVEIMRCLENLTSPTEVQYKCPLCAKNVTAYQTIKFASFPQVLTVQALRFDLINWVPQKFDVPLLVPQDLLSLDRFLGKGILDNEIELPESAEDVVAGPVFNVEAMSQLTGMGFPDIRCQRALLATGNSDADAAMNWLFEHMEDADIDDPLPAAGGTAAGSEPTADQISSIVDMGFSPAQGRKALRETGGDTSRAVEWLISHPDDQGEDEAPSTSPSKATKSLATPTLPANYRLKAFISHKGPSVHSGHYVAHVRVGDGWVLFNDEKVVKADSGLQSADALSPFAYVYIFERV